MKHIENTIIALSISALLLATACNKVYDLPGGLKNMGFEAQVASSPMSSEDEAHTKAQSGNSPAGECFLTDENGTISLPVTCEVMDAVDAPATKGSLINYNDNPSYKANALSAYLTEFKAFAYNSKTGFFTKAANNCETVTYSSGKWSASNTYKWAEDTELQILAYANASSDSKIYCTEISGKMAECLEYSIPEKASDQNDILLGVYTGKGDRSVTDVATAPVVFQHPLSSVRVKIESTELAKLGAIKKISLIGVMEKYSYTLKYDGTGEGSAFTGSGYNRIVYQDKDGGLDIDTDGYIGVPFIIAPQDISSYPVSLKVETVSGMTLYASLSNVGNKLDAGKVNVFDIGYDNNVYVFNLLGDSDVLTYKNTTASETQSVKLVSYRHPLGNPSDTEAVAFKAEYSTDGGVTWTESNTDLTGFSSNNTGCITATGYNLTASKRTRYVADPDSHFIWENESYGSMLDLSTVDANGDAMPGGASSANCYVIHHPGEYKFPLVYGNALQNGSITSSAYHTSNSGERILSTFLNCFGEEIRSGYILTDLNLNGHSINPKACLLWQDAWEGRTETNPGVGFITNVGIDGGYMTFETATGADLIESNAMIALYDEKGSNDQYDEGVDQILWSWHIWASETDFSADACKKSENGDYYFSPVNIGFCKGRKVIYKVDQDDYKQVLIRLTQLQGHAAPIIITVNRPDVTASRNADCSLFQTWRKDPVRAAIKGGVKDCYTFEGASIPKANAYAINTGYTVAEALATEISHPDRVMKYPNYKILPICNLWSMENINNKDSHTLADDNKKTVYDPSPVGYKVPTFYALKNLKGESFQIYTDARPDMNVNLLGEVEFMVSYFYYNWSSIPQSNPSYLSASFFVDAFSGQPACAIFDVTSQTSSVSVGNGNQSAHPLLPIRDTSM